MKSSSNHKFFFHDVRSKVLAAFLLACVAIVFALSITYFSFRGLLDTVDQLSLPNEKLKILNAFFQRVTQLDQQQRGEAIKNPRKPARDFLNESKALFLTIDTLHSLDWEDSRQIERIDAMGKILTRRDQLFLSYLKLRTEFIYNGKFNTRIDSISGILSHRQTLRDTSVRTTQQKTVTRSFTPIEQPKEKTNRSFFNRLFSKKKEDKPLEKQVEILEELSIKIDTLAVAQQDSAVIEVARIMKSLEEDQRQQNRDMIQGELELINTNTILINQLLGTLHQVEEEELALVHANNNEATQLVSTSIQRIGLVILIFFLGVALLIFLILTDITRSNFYRKQLLKAKEEAEQLGQVKQRFLANMSHEIRTPLQSILGFSEQLRQNSSADNEALAAIHSSSEHLLHIVNEVLDYSRIESGMLVMEEEPFSLLQVLEEVSSSIRIQAEQRGLVFIFEANNIGKAQLVGDAFRLRQVLYNLLGNAVKFTNTGYVKLLVELKDYGDTVTCNFQIIDTGIGINQTDIERIFHQFEQVSTSINHQYGGTGLGLTIAKKIIDTQRGKLDVNSEPGKGSVFNLTLNFPRATSVADKHKQINSTNDVHNFTGQVMIVDDDPLIVQLCSIILKKNNISHITFLDSEEALNSSNYNNIGLVLLDIRMPKVNGIELCKALRKRINKETRIIALTAHVLPQERAGLLEACFDDILTKPFKEQQLLNLVGIQAEASKPIMQTNLLDFSALRKMTMGDEALLQSILTQFIEETEDDIRKIESSLKHGRLDIIRDTIHKIAGRTGQMGIAKLSINLKEIENDLIAMMPINDLAEKITESIEDLHMVIAQMREDIIA